MEILNDVTDIPSAGTAVQLTSLDRRARAVSIQAHPDNSGYVFVGSEDVSSADCMKVLEPGDVLEVDFGEGSINTNFWYVDTDTSGDDVVWAMIL